MKIEDFKKLIQHFTEQNITSDEPHVSLRCEENNISLEEIKKIIIHQQFPLIRIVEDRPQVYKLYYQLGKQQELKVVIDVYTYRKITIRTVKRLVHKFKLGVIKRRRF